MTSPSRVIAALAALLAAAIATGAVAQERDLMDPIDLGEWAERPTMTLSLRDSLAMAMNQNLDIQVQDFERGISGEGVDSARSAYDSTVTSQVRENEVNSQNADPFAGPPLFEIKTRQFSANWNDPTTWGGNFNVLFFGQKQKSTFASLIPQYNTGLNLTYQQSVLRNWGVEVNEAPITIAKNNQRISESDFRNTVITTIESVEAAYWELVFARGDLDVKLESMHLAQELLRINRAKVEVGALARLDVTQAEAGVASRVQDVIVSVGNLLNAEDSLRQLLNPDRSHAIWSSTLVPSDEPVFVPEAPDEADAITTALASRPELERQRITIESNALQEKVDYKAKRWDLILEGRYNLEGLEGYGERCTDPTDPATCTVFLNTDFMDAVEGLDETEFADWTLQATLTVPIGNRAAKARYNTSRLRHRQSQVQLDNLVLAAEMDVRQKVRDIRINIERVNAAAANVALQQKNVDAEKKKFENGMSTSFQVLEIQEDLATAKSQENRAKVDYQKSLAALERAKGTLLDARSIEVSSYGAPGEAAGT